MPADAELATGEPVDASLLLEPIGFDDPPPRTAGIPALVEPVAEPPPAPRRTVPSPPRPWLGAAKSMLPTGRPHYRVLAIAGGVAAAVLVGILFFARIGPFAALHAAWFPDRTAGPPPNDPAQRFGYLQRRAGRGEADAELQLAILYAKGEGVAQDYAAAAKWFRAAALQGVPRAQYDLGVLYERGRGVPVDLTEAANWYLKAAEGKYPLAQYNLAVAYTKGQGIRKDLAEAALWYRRAALQGVVQAMIILGTVYERGEGMPASAVDAYAWYRAAGQRGNQSAATHAGEVYAALTRLDQLRAEALASDVAASIHDPAPDRPAAAPPPQPPATAGPVPEQGPAASRP